MAQLHLLLLFSIYTSLPYFLKEIVSMYNLYMKKIYKKIITLSVLPLILATGLALANHANDNQKFSTQDVKLGTEEGKPPVVEIESYKLNRNSVSAEVSIETEDYVMSDHYGTNVQYLILYNDEGKFLDSAELPGYDFEGLPDGVYSFETSPYIYNLKPSTEYSGWYFEATYINTATSDDYIGDDDELLTERYPIGTFTTDSKNYAKEPYSDVTIDTDYNSLDLTYNVYPDPTVDTFYNYESIVVESRLVFSEKRWGENEIASTTLTGNQKDISVTIDGLELDTIYYVTWQVDWKSSNDLDNLHTTTYEHATWTDDYLDAVPPNIEVQNEEVTSSSVDFDFVVTIPPVEEQEGHYPTVINDINYKSYSELTPHHVDVDGSDIYTIHISESGLSPRTYVEYEINVNYDNAFVHLPLDVSKIAKFTTLYPPREPISTSEVIDVTQNSAEIEYGFTVPNYSYTEETVMIEGSTEISVYENNESVDVESTITDENIVLSNLKPLTNYKVDITFDTTGGEGTTSCEFTTDSLGYSGGLISTLDATQGRDYVDFNYEINPNVPDDGYEKLQELSGIKVYTLENGTRTGTSQTFTNSELNGNFRIYNLDSEIEYSFEVEFVLSDNDETTLSSAKPDDWVNPDLSSEFENMTFYFAKDNTAIIVLGVFGGVVLLIGGIILGVYLFRKNKN